MELESISRRRNLVIISICIALIQVASYYIATATIRGDGALAIVQPDTLLYCQAARRIVEGAPFSFSAGSAVSTGTTSVLYPFILALPYLLGFRGASLVEAGFLLNAFFYVCFVVGWCLVACRVMASRPYARLISALLLAIFGPFAYCALAQSDIGLWMAASAWLAYGLLENKRSLYIPLLVLAPWIRPEGMVVVLVYAAFGVFNSLRHRRLGVELLVGVISVLSMSGVFVLNYMLTGACQFSSVADKGYFHNLGFQSAVFITAIDALQIAKSYFLGIPRDAPRDFFFIPFVGAALMWIGIFARSWRNVTWREVAWYVSALGGIAMVAASGWQNTNLDRYLMWIMPVLLLYMAYGVDVVSAKIRSGKGRVLLGGAVVCFACAMAFVFVCVFRVSAMGADLTRKYAARCEEVMPKGASVGVWGGCGGAYEMSDRHVVHITGIYSPEFLGSDTAAGKMEILKNEPGTRFDYWICRTTDFDTHYGGKPNIVAGEAVLASPPDMELRKADWAAFDAAAEPPVAPVSEGTLRAHVDVAYDKSEKLCRYEVLTRDDYPTLMPILAVGQLKGTNIVEGGRFVLGGDAMTVSLEPGRDVHVVMRTALKCKAGVWRELGHKVSEFSLTSPMRLQVLVDGVDVGTVQFNVGEGDFCDARFVIPGRFFASATPRLTFLGEHLAYAYWFFQ